MLYSDKHFDIKAFKKDASQWAKEAKQCKCCKAWALLDENGHCSYCWTDGHEHAQITIKLK